jgi:hypothetical protein
MWYILDIVTVIAGTRHIPVVLKHQFLVLLLELSIINKLLLKHWRGSNLGEVINHKQWYKIHVVGIVDTKNVLVLISLGRDQDLMQKYIDVRSALKRMVLTFGYVIQLRRSMESKAFSIAMQSTMWKGNYLSPLLVLLVVKIVSFLIWLKNRNSTN